MKWYNALALALVVALISVVSPVFADANIHLSKIPKGVVSNIRGETTTLWNWNDAKAGKYLGRTFLFGLTVTQVQHEQDKLYLTCNITTGGTIIIETAQNLPNLDVLRVPGRAIFLCHYLGNVSVTFTNQETGEQKTNDIPLFEAIAAGITLAE